MEEFVALPWIRNNPRTEAMLLEYFAIDFAHYEDDIFNLHINEIDPIHQPSDLYVDDVATLQFPKDPRTGQTVRQLEIDTTKPLKLFNDFPSGSRLKRSDHQHCLTVLNKLNMRLPFVSPQDVARHKQYMKLMTIITNERQLFSNFVRNYFNTHLVSRKKAIAPELNELVVHIWRKKLERRLKETSAGGLYHLRTAVVFNGASEKSAPIEFVPATDERHETGVVRHLFAENIIDTTTLKRHQRIIDRFQEEWSHTMRSTGDSDIDTILLEQPDITFVIGSGTLAFLMNSFLNGTDQWLIPFKVHNRCGRHVLHIGNKLPPTNMMTHWRNVKAVKYLVRSFMTIPQSKKQHVDEAPANSGGIRDRQFKATDFDEYMRRVGEKQSQRKSIVENNFYQIWKINDGQEIHHLLLKSHIDCHESLRKLRIFINISIKLEYQPEFGAEQMTECELIAEWARQLLRPHSRTLRLRINAVTHAIISHHYLEQRDIEEELTRLYNINPSNLFGNLWPTLKLLYSFPPGNYMMQRNGKIASALSVYEQLDLGVTGTPTAVTIDLRKYYQSVEFERPALEEYQWVPIDKSVITRLHRENVLLPCTFPHWTFVRPITSREKLQNKSKPPAKPVEETKTTTTKKKSKSRQLRRKEKTKIKKMKAKIQGEFIKKVQQSLDQYAPYAGPSKVTIPYTQAYRHDASQSPASSDSPKEPPDGNQGPALTPIDYRTYRMQANVGTESPFPKVDKTIEQ